MSLLVLCPTRGRPDKAAELIASFRATAHLFSTDLVLVVDHDDPTADGYRAVIPALSSPQPLQPSSAIGLLAVTGGSLTLATNEAVVRVWETVDIVGHVGDDHRFRTPGWDVMVEDVLRSHGVAYGDDGYWHDQIPTAWFVTTDIVRRLGWLALPVSDHYGIDNAWKDIGGSLGCLYYLPDMHIDHPALEDQKRDGDAIYRRAQRHRRQDAKAYYAWRDRGGLAADMVRLSR